MKKRAAMILCATMLVFAVSACSSSEEATEDTTVENVTIEDEGSDTDSDTGSDTDSGTDSGETETSDTAPNTSEMTIEGEITYCDGAEMDVKADDGTEYKFQIATADVTGDGGLEEGTKVTVTADGQENDSGLYEATKVEQQ